MGEYVALSGFDSASSSTSDVSVFDRKKGYNRLHSGVGAQKFLTGQAAGKGVTLTSGLNAPHLETFAGQLGQGIADQIKPFQGRDDYYASVPKQLSNLSFKERQEFIKPYGTPWNKQTKQQYPDHWKLINPRVGQKKLASQRRDQAELSRGQPQNYGKVLPFSNNIGPGNSIQPALTDADSVAQGHDLHYQDAKKPEHVLHADREAINQFSYEAIHGKNPISQLQASAGAVGLGIKHLAESSLGKVIYGGKFVDRGLNDFVLGCLEQDHWDLRQMNDQIGVD